MSKISIPINLKGKELVNFLLANKAAIINEKKSIIKRTETTFADIAILNPVIKGSAAKADLLTEDMIPDADTLRVKVVANTANWCDSQMDVLLADCWKKSINERKGMIPHLHDHDHCIEAKIGEVVDIYPEMIKLTDFGLQAFGETQALIFVTDVMKSYNEKIFNQYKLKKINQHSIGLQYVKIELAINDEESEKEYDFWNKYYPLVINKEKVDERGYFWVVSEIKLLENSCVLFGCNELTPTIETLSDTGEDQPPAGTGKQQPSTVNNKSIAVCPMCNAFVSMSSNYANCPSCGQYVSSQNQSAETETIGEMGKAIDYDKVSALFN